MNIRNMRIVECVARHQSFSRAAEEICLSNAAVSAAVTKAEEDIGLPLFDRSTRHVRLTPLGERFMPRVRLLIRDYDDLMRDVAQSVKRRGGRVRVGCLASVAVRIMPEALARCRRAYPDVEVEIRDAAARAVYEEVSAAVTDFAIVGRFEPRSELEFDSMLRDPMVLICPADSPLARRDHVGIDQLGSHPFIMMSRETAVRAVLSECAALAMDRLHIRQEVTQLSSVLGMVEEGLGISIVPALALPRHMPPNLAVVRDIRPPIEREIGMLRRADRPLSPAALALLSCIREVCDTTAA
jgi:DNA-binding transcriptional LysR family regulator